MKKYLLLGLVIVVLGVLGARVWFARSAADAKEQISPEQLAGWVQNPDNIVFDVKNDSFYIQEAIGSTGAELTRPEQIKGNFTLRFQLMSLTRAADIRFSLSKGTDVYDMEMKIGLSQSKLRLLKNRLLVLEKDGVIIRPDVYYSFSLAKSAGSLNFAVNEVDVLQMQIADAPLNFSLSLTGEPDHPAAVEIRDMEIIRQ